MSYNKTTWETGDIITAAKLNNMENGIAAAGAGGMIVEATIEGSVLTLGNTWQEINDALEAGQDVRFITTGGGVVSVFIVVSTNSTGHYVYAISVNNDTAAPITLSASSADGYPTTGGGGGES